MLVIILQLSLIQLAVADSNGRDYKLGEVKRFCPSIQVCYYCGRDFTLFLIFSHFKYRWNSGVA